MWAEYTCDVIRKGWASLFAQGAGNGINSRSERTLRADAAGVYTVRLPLMIGETCAAARESHHA